VFRAFAASTGAVDLIAAVLNIVNSIQNAMNQVN